MKLLIISVGIKNKIINKIIDLSTRHLAAFDTIAIKNMNNKTYLNNWI